MYLNKTKNKTNRQRFRLGSHHPFAISEKEAFT